MAGICATGLSPKERCAQALQVACAGKRPACLRKAFSGSIWAKVKEECAFAFALCINTPAGGIDEPVGLAQRREKGLRGSALVICLLKVAC